MSKIIGIDLGTTNSVVAVMEGDQVKVLTNAQGSRLTPSVVAITEKGERLVGQIAKHQQVTNPENTVFSIKRFMGRRHSEVATEEKMVPYKIVGGPEELVKVNVRGKQYTPPEISAMILQDLKKTAEDYLGQKIDRAVITVPAYFNDSQRKATKDAGEIAGLKVERILNEPTAAALAYGADKKKEQTVAVFDLGGGTFDISIIVLDPEIGTYEVRSVSGDGHLGGDDYDEVLINFLAEEFRKKEGVDLRKDPMALQRLKEAAEKAKCELSTVMETAVNLPYITATASGPKHLQVTLTRAQFEQMTRHLTERCRKPVMDALEAVRHGGKGLGVKDIDEVLLVGGSTRMPAVQALCKEIFGKEPNKSLNPDEVVAIGAAKQGAVLSGEDKEGIVLLEVTPLTLGVETLGGVATALIEANTTIPTSKSETFSTAADGQTEVTIHVLQGNRPMAADNRTLGRFNLGGLAAAPRGMPQIEVTFDIDRNGIINVSAKDKATGKEQSIRIEGSGGLSKEEVERMKRDAEAHAAEDLQKAELVKIRNVADAHAFEIERQLAEHGDKIPADERSKVEASVNNLRSTLKTDDAGAIKKAHEQLMKDAQQIGKIIYEKVAQAGGPQGGPSGPGGFGGGPGGPGFGGQGGPGPGGSAPGGQSAPQDDVIDAEYEVKK
ncbi:MAG: molecular chaperone DnaK [Planctomycetes bacterium]|nr:molecular chaperone DnaK [Planctomycetota bacterium]MBI3832883.1 molecular chaperone DnaK [Planctomycetota bacterium]